LDYEFIVKIAYELEQSGYLVERDPFLAGSQALFYARSAQRYQLGFAKIEDHFLFVDWENGVFAQLERLTQNYQAFSRFVNQTFRVPHALRMQIPNLALVAVSQTVFPEIVVRFARKTNLTPWYRGETGQIILVDTTQKQVISMDWFGGWRSPTRGVLPLRNTANLIRSISQNAFVNTA